MDSTHSVNSGQARSPQVLMRYLLFAFPLGIILLILGAFFLLTLENKFEIKPVVETTIMGSLIVPEAEKPSAPPPVQRAKKSEDLPNQKPLSSPASPIKAIYATSWSAGSPSKMNYLINLIKQTELNAIVIDLKDYSGLVTYDIKVPEVEKYGAKEIRIPRINSLIKRLHDENIYIIGRITVFQDPVLAKARPDLAVKNKTTGEIWKDRKELSWIDPASKDAWDYTIKISKDAAERGFDELNFDYIRFPSDGDLSILGYPFYDEKTTLKADVIKDFFVYLRTNLKGIKISADLFGIAAFAHNDLGIGQLIEDAYQNFDYVSLMVYPSHYGYGSLGYKNPAQFPYEVVKHSMEQALQRLTTYNLQQTTATSSVAGRQLSVKLRPWLQDFDLGADYTAEMVRKEIQAVDDSYSFCSPASGRDAQICDSSPDGLGDKFGGWMLWDPNNVYTKEALLVE